MDEDDVRVSTKTLKTIYVWLDELVNPNVRYSTDTNVMKDEVIRKSQLCATRIRKYLEDSFPEIYEWSGDDA